MKQKILASIAAGLVILGGVITPAFGLLTPQLGVHYAEAQENPDNVKTSICGTGEFFVCPLMSAISEVIMYVPISLATISGMAFDYSIWNSIQSGTYTKYDGTDGNEGLVVSGWKLVRDFTNLLFIFALFVIAFTLILDLDGGDKVTMTSNPKRTLARVLMMALLVNFSFFMARSVIDITNKLSLQFYTNMSKAPEVTLNADTTEQDVNSFYAQPGNETIHSIATGIISKINPQDFLLDSKGAAVTAGPGKYAKLFFLSLVSACFGFFLAYIFLSIAILFIGRTIGLYLAVIISPLAFVSYTVPFLQRQPYIGFDDWMKQFMGLAFMGPIFLFFVYIGIQFFTIPISLGQGQLSSTAGILFKFAIIAMFFTLAKRIAKDMSGKIGDMATGIVTGALTSVATIGAAAATGGGSAALMATRQEAARHATSISQQVMGNEKTAALQQRLGGLRNFKNLPGGKGAAVTGLATMITGSKVPGQIYAAGKEGARIGRVENFGKLRQQILAQRASQAANANTTTPTVTNPTGTTPTQTTNSTTPPKAPVPVTSGTGVAPKPAMPASGAQLTLRPTTGAGTNPTQNKTTPTTATTSATTTKTTPSVASGTGVAPKPAMPAKDAELTFRPKNNFAGDAKFDRPKETIDEKDAAQKAESQKATAIYNRENALKGNSMNVENLTVKNLNVQSTQNAQPTKIDLPSRTGNTGLTPQKQASTFLTGIQMAPHSGSKAVNYKAGDFEKNDASSVFGTEENDDVMRAQLTETKPKPPAPEPIFGSEENDDILRAQITAPETNPVSVTPKQ